MPPTHPSTPFGLRAPVRLGLGAAVLALAMSSSSLEAQAPEQGTWSIGLPLFTENPGSILNVEFMTTSRLKLGLEVDLQTGEVEQDVNRPTVGLNSNVESQDLALGPVVQWYGSSRGPVTPFVRFRGLVGWGDEQIVIEGEPFRETDTTLLAGSLAIGAEWFPVRQLSLSGFTGFEYSRRTLERVEFDGDVIERNGSEFGTFLSALAVTFYFR